MFPSSLKGRSLTHARTHTALLNGMSSSKSFQLLHFFVPVETNVCQCNNGEKFGVSDVSVLFFFSETVLTIKHESDYLLMKLLPYILHYPISFKFTLGNTKPGTLG